MNPALRSAIRGVFAVLLAAAAGCDQQAWFERFAPKEEVEAAKAYLALFPRRDFDAIEKAIDPSLKGPALRPKLERVAAVFPGEAPRAVRLMGYRSNTTGNTTVQNISLEYEYPATWLVASVVLEKTPGGTILKGVQVEPVKESLAAVNRFTFEGKGGAHYGMLAAAILIPLFIIFTVVVAARTPIPKRKWLWIVFVLLGLVQLSFNWTTGDVGVSALSVELLGAGFVKASPFAPLVLTISFPLGAIVFLIRRKRWLAPPAQNRG
jgi:hypothetical protein